MYRQLRANKGSIAFTFDDPPLAPSKNSPNDCIAAKQQLPNAENGPENQVQSADNSSAMPISSPTENNTLSPCLPSDRPNSQKPIGNEKNLNNNENSHCARILPLKQMRKRKLVKSASTLAGATRKIARYSTIQCSCNNYPTFAAPCVLCNGRYSYLQVIDADCMPHYERYALLDPCYHPVLSLPNGKNCNSMKKVLCHIKLINIMLSAFLFLRCCSWFAFLKTS